MEAASNTEVHQAGTEKMLSGIDIISKGPDAFNSSPQKLHQTDNESSSLTDVESSIERSKIILKHDTKGQSFLGKPTPGVNNDQDYIDTPTQYFSLNAPFDKPSDITRDLSKFFPKEDDAIYSKNTSNPSIRKYSDRPFSEDTESNCNINSSNFKEAKSTELFPPLSRCIKSSRDAEKASIFSESFTVPSIISDIDWPLSEEAKLNYISNSSVIKKTEPTVLLSSPIRCVKPKGVEKGAVCDENPILSSRRNKDNFSEETELNYRFNSLALKEAEPTGLSRCPSSIKLKDAEKSKEFTSTPGDIIDLSTKNKVAQVTNSEFPFKPPFSEIDNLPFATENTNDDKFSRNLEKYVRERLFEMFLHPEASPNGHITESHDTNSKYSVPSVDLPETNSEELPKPIEKTRILADKVPDKSLTEFVLNLVNWKKTGHDKAFNIPIADNIAKFRKDLLFGLDLMKELITHIRTLMSAANNLPFLDARADITDTGVAVWHTINDLQLSIIGAINDMTTNPDAVMNLFNKMTQNLSSLSEEIGDFRDKIRVFCSEIVKLM